MMGEEGANGLRRSAGAAQVCADVARAPPHAARASGPASYPPGGLLRAGSGPPPTFY